MEVRRDPGPIGEEEYGYRLLQIIPDDGELAPLELPDLKIAIVDLLPE